MKPSYRFSRRFTLPGLLLAAALFLVLAGIAAAQSGGGYDLTWSSVDGGGGMSSGSGFDLSGTLGQPDAGLLSSGALVLFGGFWHRGPAVPPTAVTVDTVSTAPPLSPLLWFGLLVACSAGLCALRLGRKRRSA